MDEEFFSGSKGFPSIQNCSLPKDPQVKTCLKFQMMVRSDCIDTAGKFTKTPIVALEHVDGERETIGEEHHKVRYCKIDD